MSIISKEQSAFEKSQISERFRNVIGANTIFHKSDKKPKTARRIKKDWEVDPRVLLSSENYAAWIKEFDYSYLGFLSECFVIGIMGKREFNELWEMLDRYDASFVLFGIPSSHGDSNGNANSPREFEIDHLKSMGEYLARRNKIKNQQEEELPVEDVISEQQMPF